MGQSPSPSRASHPRPLTSLPDFPPPSLFTLSTLHSHCAHYHSFPSLLQLQREKEAQTPPTPSASKASHPSASGGEVGGRPRSRSRVPIIIGNLFQGSVVGGGWGEEEKVAVSGGVRVGGGAGYGSEEGRSRPVSSRGSRR